MPDGQAFILPITLGRGTPMNFQPMPKVPQLEVESETALYGAIK